MSIRGNPEIPCGTHPLATAFARAFEGEKLPEIDDFRGNSGSLSLLVELVSIDLEMRSGKGAARCFSHYLDQYPQLASRPEIVSQLAEIDIRLKRNAGVTINPRDYPELVAQPAPPPPFTTPIPTGSPSAYQRLREIGRGGMSVVYLARQASVNRLVALKVLRDDGGGFDAREVLRFLTEAESIASIRHRHVVQIHDFGAPKGSPPFLALEYLSGGTLADELSRGPMAPGEAARLVANLASAIQAAHSMAIVHRDLKPGNVLFDENGVAKVIDFGLAKRTHSDLTITQSLMGTPCYMAPEQADRKARFVGPEADIWALGAILYECLTGRRPFTDEDSIAVLHAIRYEQPENPRKLIRTIPKDLEQVCLKCLEKNPSDRYPSAEALEEDLRAWLDHRPISIRGANIAEQALKWTKRNKALAMAMVLAASVLVLAALVSTGFGLWALDEQGRAEEKAREYQAQRIRADAKALSAEQERIIAASQRDRAELMIYANHLQAAEREWEAGRPGMALEQLGACRWDLRGPEHHFLYSQFNKGQVTLLGHRDPVTAVAISPDLKTVISGDQSGRVLAWELSTASRLLDKPGSVVGPISSIHVNPANTEVAIWNANGLRLHGRTPDNGWSKRLLMGITGKPGQGLSVAGNPFALGWLMAPLRAAPYALAIKSSGGSEAEVALMHQGYANHGPVTILAANLDGTLFAVARGTSFCIHDGLTKKRIGEIHLQATRGRVTAMDFSPEGSCLAVAFADGSLRLYRFGKDFTIEDATDLPNPVLPKGMIHAIRFTPDARYLLTGGESMILTAWDWQKGRIAATMMGHRKTIRTLAVSPDGRFAATGSDDCTIRIHDLGLVNDEQVLAMQMSDYRSVVASEDAGVIAALDQASHHLIVLDGQQGRITRRFSDPSPLSPAFTLSGDGQRLAMACKDGTVRIVRLRTGKFMPSIDGLGGSTTALALSRDGKRLAVSTLFTQDPHSEGTIRLIDTDTGSEIFRKRGPGLGLIRAMRIPKKGPAIITGDHDGIIRLWDASGETRPLRGTISKPDSSGIDSIVESRDGAMIAACHADGTIVSWKIEDDSPPEQLSLKGSKIMSMAFMDNSDRIICCQRRPSGRMMAGFYDLRTGAQLLLTSLDSVALGSVRSTTVAHGPVGPIVVLGHARGLRRVSADREQDVHWLYGAPGKVQKCEARPDDRHVTAIFQEYPPTHWSLVTGQMFHATDTPVESGLPSKQVRCTPLANFVMATDNEARARNRDSELRFTSSLTTPDHAWHQTQADLAEQASNAHGQAFHLAKARKIGPWDGRHARKEWEILQGAGSTPLAECLKRDLALDTLGRLLALPSGMPDPRRPAALSK